MLMRSVTYITLALLNLAKQNYNYFDSVSCFARSAFRSFGRRFGLSFKQQHCAKEITFDSYAQYTPIVAHVLKIFCTGRFARELRRTFSFWRPKHLDQRKSCIFWRCQKFICISLNHKIRFPTHKAGGFPAQAY